MAYREFTDEDGVPWRAWDTYPTAGSKIAVQPSYESGWLSFECETERRRLMPVPSAWDGASDDGLRAWLTQAEPVRRAAPRKTSSG